MLHRSPYLGKRRLGIETVECGRCITDTQQLPPHRQSGCFLLDSVTALLGNEMFDDQAGMTLAAETW